jgi:hypothetical protein
MVAARILFRLVVASVHLFLQSRILRRGDMSSYLRLPQCGDDWASPLYGDSLYAALR